MSVYVIISTRFVFALLYPQIATLSHHHSSRPGPRMSRRCPVSPRHVRCKSAHRELLNLGRKATAVSKLKTTRLPRCTTPRYCCSTQPKTSFKPQGNVNVTSSLHLALFTDKSRFSVSFQLRQRI